MGIRNFIYLIFALLALMGCKNSARQEFELPEPSTMAAILAEVHLAEATLADNSSTISSENHKGGYKLVLEKYGLDKADFDSSIAYYSTKPLVYQKIYEDVLAILTAKELSVRALKDDSIKISNPKKDKIVQEGTRSIWKGNRALKISNQDSTQLKAAFDIAVDSIIGGSISLTAKYKFSRKGLLREKHKMQLFATYSDGSRDTTETTITNTVVFKDISTQLTLKQRDLKRVSGNLVIFSVAKPLNVEIINIQLDWNRSASSLQRVKE